MPDYRIRRLRGAFVLVWYDGDGHRHRYSLDTADPRQAERLAPALYAELTRPTGSSVADMWRAFMAEKVGRAIIVTMVHTWKALAARFGGMPSDTITVADCRAHIEERRKASIRDWTIYTELGHLRMVLRWAEKQGLISKAPHIERPATPKPREGHLTRAQARALIDGAASPHVRLYIMLALATGARNAALLELTWERCDFERGLIDLRNSLIVAPTRDAPSCR